MQAKNRRAGEVKTTAETSATTREVLSQLGGDHLLFHDVATRFGEIDHVALSRCSGIFAIETKPHSGRVSVVDSRLRVNGKIPEKDFVAQSLKNTYWLIEEIRSSTGLEARINPLLVFTNASVETERPVKGIPITDRKSLLEIIQREGEPMQPALWDQRGRLASLLGSSPTTETDDHITTGDDTDQAPWPVQGNDSSSLEITE